MYPERESRQRKQPNRQLLTPNTTTERATSPPTLASLPHETAASDAAHNGWWPGWVVLLCGLGTSLLTGLYAGRAWSVVALGEGAPLPAIGDAETEEPHETLAPGEDAVLLAAHVEHEVPTAMMAPLYVLAVPAVLLGLVMVRPPQVLAGLHVDLATGVTGAMLSLAGLGWALSAPRLGVPDIAAVLDLRTRALLLRGFGLDAVQDAVVVRPVQALARVAGIGDRDVIDAYVRLVGHVAGYAGRLLRRTQTGLATGYAAWLVIGAVAVAVAGVVLS